MTPVIFINCKEFPFVQQIMNGTKTYETRNRNTLKRFIGEHVLIAETGNGAPIIRCSATIWGTVEVFTRSAWLYYMPYTEIPNGSRYDWQPGTKKKVLYRLENVQRIKPFELNAFSRRHGRVWAECTQEFNYVDIYDNYDIM